MLRIALSCCVAAAAAQGLVAPGGLVPAGGSAGPVGGRRRGGGWGVVDKWPAGFFVGGSGAPGMDGVYVRADGTDHAMPRLCELTWKHVDNGWKMASAQVDGYAGVDGARKEWLLVDEAGRDVLATPGKHYLPGGARAWRLVRREFRYWAVGDAAETRADEPGFWARGERGKVVGVDGPDEERPVRWRRFRDGKIFDVGAWRLRRAAGADVAAAAGADVAAAGDAGDDVRPWQIVGIMSRERLDELLEQKRQYDEDAARARRRGGGGAATEAVAFLPAASAGAGLVADAEACAADRARAAPGAARAAADLCRDGDFDGADAVLAPADGPGPPRDGEFWAASSFCARRRGDFAGAADLAREGAVARRTGGRRDAGRGAALLELALASLDLGLPCDALDALEALYALDRTFPGLGTWLLRCHARARAAPCCARAAATDLCVGQRVETTAALDGFWAAGDAATVVGVAAPGAPVALRMARSGRLIDVQRDRVVAVADDGEIGEPPFDPYAALGVACDFSPEELRRAYRSASRDAHPDKEGGSQAKFTAVARAYEVLGDDRRRADYDAGLDLPGERAQGFTLAEELRTHYFPELRPFHPFGDPQENRRDQEARDAAQAERAKKSCTSTQRA